MVSVKRVLRIARGGKEYLSDYTKCMLCPGPRYQVQKSSSDMLQNRGWSGMHVETLDPGNQRVCDVLTCNNP